MTYYHSTRIKKSFDESVAEVRDALSKQGFGVLTEIDVQATMKAKLGVDFRPYRILGACNPPAAHRALQAEKMIGTMLPCNVVVQQTEPGVVEIAAVDPVASMQAVDNKELLPIATEIREKLKSVIASLT